MNDFESAAANLARYIVDPALQKGLAEKGQIVLLLVELRDDNPIKTNQLISNIIDKVHVEKGTVYNVIGSIIFATFERSFDKISEAERHCANAATSVQDLVENEGKVLYGVHRGNYALFGPKGNRRNVVFTPNFNEIITQLDSVEFGTAAVVK